MRESESERRTRTRLGMVNPTTAFEMTPVIAQARASWYSRARVNSKPGPAEDGGAIA
jgi:hypothetical protein